MKCRTILQTAVTLLAGTSWLTALAAATADRPPARHEFVQMHMGMPFKLALYAADEASANVAARAAFARIKELNGVMSDYEPESELMLLCKTAGQGKPVKVSDDLLAVLTRSCQLSERSGGAFDVSVGPLVKLWRKARRSKELPHPDQIESARAAVDYRQIRIDAKAQTIELLKPGMQLDLGGIAVGYAIDQALDVLKKLGVRSALIDGSGDIGVSDAPPGTDGWRIGIAPLEPDADPSRFLLLKNAAVTTSGDAWQYVEIAGKRYSHIVDPHTGLGLTERSSVTVIARDCTAADSYATAVSVLGPERGMKLIEETPAAAVLIVRVVEGKPQTHESKRLREWEAKSQ